MPLLFRRGLQGKRERGGQQDKGGQTRGVCLFAAGGKHRRTMKDWWIGLWVDHKDCCIGLLRPQGIGDVVVGEDQGKGVRGGWWLGPLGMVP